ncbi:hypothetical protein BS47DRAFT_1351356, partial [Hydnum rufescens UP504]
AHNNWLKSRGLALVAATRSGYRAEADGEVSRIPPSLAIAPVSPDNPHVCLCTSIDQRILSISLRVELQISSQGANVSPLRIAVVGSGQSAADVLLNLHGRLASISLHHDNHDHSEGSLKPSDDFVYDLPFKRCCGAHHCPKVSLRVIFTSVTWSSEASLSCEDATVVNAEHSAPVSHTFTITLRHILGVAPDEERTYDAIIMGTGYERQSWLHMLDEDSFGNVFGFSNRPSSSGFAKANHSDRGDSGKIDAEDPQEIYAPYRLRRQLEPHHPSPVLHLGMTPLRSRTQDRRET